MTRRKPTEYNWAKLKFDESLLSKHHTKGRRAPIKFVVIHHMTIKGNGTGSANDACYRLWQDRKASAHYGIDGIHVRRFVRDRDTAWSTGNNTGNDSGVSIEHANETAEPQWKIGMNTFATSVKLVAQLHVYHKLGRPTSTNNGRSGTIRKHSSFKSTKCPGPHFDSYWNAYVKRVQEYYDILVASVPKPSITDTKKTRYRVVKTSTLNARSGPGTQYPVKKVRSLGFEFNSTKRSGDWVRASKYWYHTHYLEEVRSEVDIRVGSLNIPLDPAKLPDGKRRTVIAAEQINNANLHVLAVQELDRGATAKSDSYAIQLRDALGKDWAFVPLNSNYNENYLFYRKTKVSDVGHLPDLILPSKEGGRHAKRANMLIGGTIFTFMSTHLVHGEGKSRAEARQQQAARIAEHTNKNTIVMGDFNQDSVPLALAKTHKDARTSALSSNGSAWGTYVTWGKKQAAKSRFLDHILVPKSATVLGYTLVGLNTSNGLLHQPRASDHLLIVASIKVKA